MIRTVKELPRKNDTYTRDFEIITEYGYGLSTVLGFVKYHLSTSKVELVHEKMFTGDNKYIYSIYGMNGNAVGKVICHTDKNQFDIFYDIGLLYASGLSIGALS